MRVSANDLVYIKGDADVDVRDFRGRAAVDVVDKSQRCYQLLKAYVCGWGRGWKLLLLGQFIY